MKSKREEIAEFILANGFEEPNDPPRPVLFRQFIASHGKVHKSGLEYTRSDVSNAYLLLREQAQKPVTKKTASVTDLAGQIAQMTQHLSQPEQQRLIKHLCIEWDLSMP